MPQQKTPVPVSAQVCDPPQAICVALHPGTVDTGLSAPFAKSGLQVQAPAEAAARLLAVIGRLGLNDSGEFFDHRGEPVPW